MTLQRRFRISMVVFALLGIAIWTMMTGDLIPVHGQSLSMRAIALLILGLFVVKTLLHWKAEQVRTSSDKQ